MLERKRSNSQFGLTLELKRKEWGKSATPMKSLELKKQISPLLKPFLGCMVLHISASALGFTSGGFQFFCLWSGVAGVSGNPSLLFREAELMLIDQLLSRLLSACICLLASVFPLPLVLHLSANTVMKGLPVLIPPGVSVCKKKIHVIHSSHTSVVMPSEAHGCPRIPRH